MARLRVVSGPNAGLTVDVDEEVVIGREDTDLAIDDEEMSRRHAVVRRHANRLQVEDLGSTNGTFVDGTRIAEPTLLGGGAEIKVGTTLLVVEGVLPVSDPSADIIQPRNVTRVSRRDLRRRRRAGTGRAGATATATAPAPAPPVQPVVGEFRPPERSSQAAGARVAIVGAGGAVVRHGHHRGDRAGHLLHQQHS